MDFGMPVSLSEPATTAFVAGLLAAVACGLEALPVFLLNRGSHSAVGRAHAFAAGLMIAATLLVLIWPGVVVSANQSRLLGGTIEMLA